MMTMMDDDKNANSRLMKNNLRPEIFYSIKSINVV